MYSYFTNLKGRWVNMFDAIYCRQSIDKKDSLSIESQIKLCRKFAGDDVKVFTDRGFSGKSINRPAFKELIEAVKNGLVRKIIVYRLDRFSRSISDFSRLWEIMEKYNVEFVSATENFDTSSPVGRAMLNIVTVFAQLERETTAERVRDNYHHRHTLGSWLGGPAPYGFNLSKIYVEGKPVSTLVANENAVIVERIFKDYSNPDTSLRMIAKKLTDQGVPGPKRAAWDSVTISRILHSPLYVCADKDVYWFYIAKGCRISQSEEFFDGSNACSLIGRRDRTRGKYNDISQQSLSLCNHSGFIDSKTWLKIQDKLDSNSQIPRKNAGKYSWLTGLLKCSCCGYALKINLLKKENKYKLICSGKSNFGICDSLINIDLRELENYVSEKLNQIFKESPPEEILPDTKELSQNLLAIDQKIERLIGALAESSEISASYVSRQIDFLHKQREDLLKQSKSSAQKVKSIDFMKLNFDEKKLIAAEFIERIEIADDKVNIIWKI